MRKTPQHRNSNKGTQIALPGQVKDSTAGPEKLLASKQKDFAVHIRSLTTTDAAQPIFKTVSSIQSRRSVEVSYPRPEVLSRFCENLERASVVLTRLVRYAVAPPLELDFSELETEENDDTSDGDAAGPCCGEHKVVLQRVSFQVVTVSTEMDIPWTKDRRSATSGRSTRTTQSAPRARRRTCCKVPRQRLRT